MYGYYASVVVCKHAEVVFTPTSVETKVYPCVSQP